MGFNVIDSGMNSAMPDVASLVSNSPDEYLHRSAGQKVSKSIHVVGDGGPTDYNLFAFTGAIELLEIYGVVTTATEVTSVTATYLDVYDGATAVDLASDDFGTDLSGMTVNSFIAAVAVDGTALALLDADQVRVNQTAANRRQLIGALLNSKNGTTSYIRFNVTTDMSTDCYITWYVSWRSYTGTLAAA
jgi:hypothetical protein